MHLPTIYFTATDFGEMGLGSAGDITASRDDAYDQYAAAVMDGQPTRSFMVEFDGDNNSLETATEITDQFREELKLICEKRGLDFPEVAG